MRSCQGGPHHCICQPIRDLPHGERRARRVGRLVEEVAGEQHHPVLPRALQNHGDGHVADLDVQRGKPQGVLGPAALRGRHEERGTSREIAGDSSRSPEARAKPAPDSAGKDQWLASQYPPSRSSGNWTKPCTARSTWSPSLTRVPSGRVSASRNVTTQRGARNSRAARGTWVLSTPLNAVHRGPFWSLLVVTAHRV